MEVTPTQKERAVLSKTQMAQIVKDAGEDAAEFFVEGDKGWAEMQEALRSGTGVIIRDELPPSLGRDYAGDSGVLDSFVFLPEKVVTHPNIPDLEDQLTTIIAEYRRDMEISIENPNMFPEYANIHAPSEAILISFINAHILFLKRTSVEHALKELSRRKATLYASKKSLDPDELLSSVQYRPWKLECRGGTKGSIVLDKTKPGVYHITLRRRDAERQEFNRELKLTVHTRGGAFTDVRCTFGRKDVPEDFIQEVMAWYQRLQTLPQFANDKVIFEFGTDAELKQKPKFYQAHDTGDFQVPLFSLTQERIKDLELQGYKRAIMVQGATDERGVTTSLSTVSFTRSPDGSKKHHLVFSPLERTSLEILSRDMEICVQSLRDVDSLASQHLDLSLMYKPKMYVAIESEEIAQYEERETVQMHIISDGSQCWYKVMP